MIKLLFQQTQACINSRDKVPSPFDWFERVCHVCFWAPSSVKSLDKLFKEEVNENDANGLSAVKFTDGREY
jgi:hypothetical protein